MNRKLFAILILGVFLVGLGSATLTDNFVSHYNLDETSGTVLDSFELNNGINYGATTGVAGKINTAYSFNGSNSISIGNDSSLTIGGGRFTLNAWINTSDTGGTIISNGESGLAGNYILGLTSGYIRLFYYTDTFQIFDSSTAIVNDNDWHMVSIVVDDTTMYSYVDGILNNSQAITGTKSGNVLETFIGARNTGGGTGFDGVIDSVSIFNESKNSTEIFELWNNGSGKQFPGEQLNVELLAPLNNTKQITDFINFTSQVNLTGTINHTNQTIYIWNENGTQFSTNTSFLIGNETIYPNWYLNDFDLGNSYIWNVESCSDDGLCYWGENNRTFTSSVFQKDSEVYDPEVYESESADFDLNITLRETSIIVSAKLFYNGTEYSGSIVDNGNDTYSISKSLFAPSVTSQENITFYWQICYEYLGDEGCENTTSNIQTINTIPEIELTNNACSAGLFEAINFSFKDEGNDSVLNVSMQYNFQYGVDNYSSKMLYGELASTNNFRVCINETLGFYKVGYGEIVYEDSNHVSRRFYLYEGQSLSNETTREYNIYDLLITDATSFIFEVKNTFLNVYADKLLALLRWYPEYNEYRVVEMAETDSDGRTVMKVETEDVDYRIGLYEKDGTLIKLADSVRMACLQDPCTYTMKVVTYDTDYFSSYDVESSLTYDETNKRFLFVWSDSEQKTSLMRLEVFKVAGNQDILICNNTSPSFTGVLSCSTGNYTGTFYAKAYRSASPEKIFDTLYHSITTGIESSFGLFLSAIMVLAVGLIGLFSPVAAIILLIISLVPSLALGAINMSIFMGIATLGGIVIHYIKKSR